MNLCKLLLLAIGYFGLGSLGLAQEAAPSATPIDDFNETVIPLTEMKFKGIEVQARFGTGFCLDLGCRYIATNYHVAKMSKLEKIRGEKVVQTYLATGPDDEGATENFEPWAHTIIKYTLIRDLAIFELRHPLPRHRGASFSLKDLPMGGEVDIYAYPKEGISPIRKLMRFHGSFLGEDITGLLVFGYALSDNKALHPGASGGIVVDSNTHQIVGILNAIERNGKHIALAVPIESLADFVGKVDPSLALALFPSTKLIPPDSPDIYPRPTTFHTDSFRHRPPESYEVKMLRTNAQLLASSMRNFIAVQTFAWGKGSHEPSFVSAYEVRVIDGAQRFREFPDGTTESRDLGPLPPLNTAITTGDQWASLPAFVGTEMGLNIKQEPDAIVQDQPIKVFQYWAVPEDRACSFLTIVDFLLFTWKRTATVECYGEVWTDKDFNILRMSEHLELLGKWKHYEGVVTYTWLHVTDQAPQLVPATISTRADFKNRIYWCRGHFTNYRMFSSRAEMKVAGN